MPILYVLLAIFLGIRIGFLSPLALLWGVFHPFDVMIGVVVAILIYEHYKSAKPGA